MDTTNIADFIIYLTGDPAETLELLKSKESPLALTHPDSNKAPSYFFHDKLLYGERVHASAYADSATQPPLISYDRPDLEWLEILGDTSIEGIATAEIQVAPTAELGFTCSDLTISDDEKGTLASIIRFLVEKKKHFLMVGHAEEGKSVFIGGYNPVTNQYFAPNGNINQQDLLERLSLKE